MRSNTRSFHDEEGHNWTVAKVSFGRFVVHAGNKIGVARSCARKLGIIGLKNGTPIEIVRDHGRIWNAIWKNGIDVES